MIFNAQLPLAKALPDPRPPKDGGLHQAHAWWEQRQASCLATVACTELALVLPVLKPPKGGGLHLAYV